MHTALRINPLKRIITISINFPNGEWRKEACTCLKSTFHTTECSCYTPVQFATGYIDDKNQVQFLKNFCWTRVHFVEPLITPILNFLCTSQWVLKPGWLFYLHSCLFEPRVISGVHLPFPPIGVYTVLPLIQF